MYKNFICYRGGSSAGILFAESIYNRALEEEEIVGKTYYSLQAAAIKEGAVTIAKQLFSDNSKQLKELLALKIPSSQIGSYPPKN